MVDTHLSAITCEERELSEFFIHQPLAVTSEMTPPVVGLFSRTFSLP